MTNGTLTVLEVHTIHSLPPGGVNRGEDGSPKSTVLGGEPRVRISSQAQKRRQRVEVPTSVRSKHLHSLLAGAMDLGGDDEALVGDVLGAAFGGRDDAGALKTMPFVGNAEVRAMTTFFPGELPTLRAAKEAVTGADKEKARKAAESAYKALLEDVASRLPLGDDVGEDVALYGRMMADNTVWNVEAATSYSHAVSVARARADADFWSAMDDVSGRSEHIGVREIVAPVMYRMAALDLGQLSRTLGRPVPELGDAARRWVHGFVRAVPHGGGHGAYSQSLPEYVLVVARTEGNALNLAGAFSPSLHHTAEATVPQQAVARLREHRAAHERVYGVTAEAADTGTVPGVEFSAASLDEAVNRMLAGLGVS